MASPSILRLSVHGGFRSRDHLNISGKELWGRSLTAKPKAILQDLELAKSQGFQVSPVHNLLLLPFYDIDEKHGSIYLPGRLYGLPLDRVNHCGPRK